MYSKVSSSIRWVSEIPPAGIRCPAAALAKLLTRLGRSIGNIMCSRSLLRSSVVYMPFSARYSASMYFHVGCTRGSRVSGGGAAAGLGVKVTHLPLTLYMIGSRGLHFVGVPVFRRM